MLCPIIQIINEDIKQDSTQHRSLMYTTSYWTPTRPCATGHYPLGPGVQRVLNPPHCLPTVPSINSFFMRISIEDNVRAVDIVLLKSRKTMSIALPSFIRLVDQRACACLGPMGFLLGAFLALTQDLRLRKCIRLLSHMK